MNITIEKVKESRISSLDPTNIDFGKLYSDHMLIADYFDGEWQSCDIMPFDRISMNPATTFIHYGQSIFEGIKAYKNPDGETIIFRPDQNLIRFNISAHRMAMPDVPQEIFMDGLNKLLNIDEKWIPNAPSASLYIRPFMFATDEFIGIKPATKFRFMIITSPAGPYYSDPVKIFVQKDFFRAFPGGTGYAKAAGNYGGVMYPTAVVKDKGYDQILWLDGVEKKYIQEIGTMNVFFVIGDKVITPNLDQGTILDGITRKSAIAVLQDNGITVEERPIDIQEIIDAADRGQLKEAFGAGTAANIAPIGKIGSDDYEIDLPPIEEWKIAPWLKETLNDIRYGKIEDKFLGIMWYPKKWLFNLI